ncbi:MAG: hypothetical protein KJI72_01580 [Patescibacteria group bacterium]|nr:hypothetical protein [Patescibacteria group bacterium]
MDPGKRGKNLIIGLVVLAGIAIIVGFVVRGIQQGGGLIIGGVGGEERTAKELQDLIVPKVGEEAPEEGVGVPGKIAEGESGNPGQQYWVFETELREGKLDPFEFRVPVGDLLGISIMNSENEDQTVHISGASAFAPNFIERTIAPGGTASMRTQVLELGEYNVLCTTCKTQVVGKFVVVPKEG